MKKENALATTDFYKTSELAKKLDVSQHWLAANRRSSMPIPFYRFGRQIRYYKTDVQAWIGRRDLELRYFNTKTLAKKLNVTTTWIETNRYSKDPIPYRKIGHMVRYQVQEVEAWLRKKSNLDKSA